MALFDSADLLARVKILAERPTVDQESPDATWFSLMTEAQLFWVREFATHFPQVMWTMEQLTTADSGVSYDFLAEPLGHYEIRQTPTGRLLLPGPDWDPGYDFVPAGNKIRFQGSKAKQFTNGPWARYVKMPGVISAAAEPTLSPTHARQLLIYRTCILWAQRGGLRDPAPYQELEDDCWYGNPLKGHVGLIGALKNQAFLMGGDAVPSDNGTWYPVDTGVGYVGGGG